MGTNKRGFASMDKKKQRELASLGGKAAHAAGTAHRFTKEEAKIAGRLGGIAARINKKRREKEEAEEKDWGHLAKGSE